MNPRGRRRKRFAAPPDIRLIMKPLETGAIFIWHKEMYWKMISTIIVRFLFICLLAVIFPPLALLYLGWCIFEVVFNLVDREKQKARIKAGLPPEEEEEEVKES